MAITTKTNVEKYLLVTIDSSFSSQISAWISSVEKYMNKQTNRQLIADSEDGEYYYDGSDRKTLVVDDFVSITSVSLLSRDFTTVSETEITDYVYFYPVNEKPIWRLESDLYYFENGRQNVKVVGQRGYVEDDSIPEDLTFAATVLVAGIVNFSHNSKGEVKSESIGSYSVTYETTAQQNDYDMTKEILKSYRRMR